MKGDIGVIGLAVMGQNLILNMNDKGFKFLLFFLLYWGWLFWEKSLFNI